MEISTLEPKHEILLPCIENTHERPSISDLQYSFESSEDSERLLVCEIGCHDDVDETKGLVLVELGSINAKDQVIDLENGDAAERKLSQAAADVSTESSQKSDEKQFRKRPYTSSEVDSLKQRRLRSNKKLYVKADSRSPLKILKKSVSSSTQWSQKVPKISGTKTNNTREQYSSPVINLTEANTIHANSSGSTNDDIRKAEADFEYDQCVSLLRKYGVLNKPEFYMSRHYPACVPHPGNVGDGQLSKRCKICRAFEDGSNTIICDECQEVFHLSCCLPRVSHKYFDREDDWYCSPCRKQRRRMGSAHYFTLSENGLADRFKKSLGTRYSSKVRVGPAHQADVPIWTGKIEDDPLSCSVGRPGTEIPIAQEAKDREREKMLDAFKNKVEALKWIPAKMLPTGLPENWLRCRNIFFRAFKDCDGHKHSEVICGKWRRAPPYVQQSDHWECFCVMEWDPLHADCAVPQELPTEDILRRILVKPENR